MDTPCLVIDREIVKKNYIEIQSAFPEFLVAYAIKSNAHEEILKTLWSSGCGFETASIEEVEKLIAMGIPPEKIIFSNPIKPLASIEGSLKNKVTHMSFDSLDEVQKFLPYKDQVKAIFRIDVSNEGSLWTLNGKFGSPKQIWPEILTYMKENEIPLAGVTFHVGSQCENAQTWGKAMESVRELVLLAYSLGLKPYILNIGGGFPIDLGRKIPGIQEIAGVVHGSLKELEKDGIVFTEFIAEPGRYISGPSGALMTKIIGSARRLVNNNIERWIYLDTGVFTGLMETIDGITYPLSSDGQGEPAEVMLSGPSCDSADKMFKTTLPGPKAGDTLCMSGTGAYTTEYSSNFNGLQGPKIVFVDQLSEPDKEQYYSALRAIPTT